MQKETGVIQDPAGGETARRAKPPCRTFSLKLSIAVAAIGVVAAAAAALFAPRIAAAYLSLLRSDLSLARNLTIYIYGLCAFAFAALAVLLALLKNLMFDVVFERRNVVLLRVLSYLFLGGAVFCLAFAWLFALNFALAAAACFMGLVVRVVKNCFEQAELIKRENDLTV